jgi:hypothetical protein
MGAGAGMKQTLKTQMGSSIGPQLRTFSLGGVAFETIVAVAAGSAIGS